MKRMIPFLFLFVLAAFAVSDRVTVAAPAPKAAAANDLLDQCYGHVHDWVVTASANCSGTQAEIAQCLQGVVNQANLDNQLCFDMFGN